MVLKIKSAAILNENKPEFFSELMSKGVDAVELEMEKQLKEIKESKEVCHVCGKEKKPYTVFIDNNMFSYINHLNAREKGPICERCDRYFAMTGELKEPNEQEFENAKEAAKFARNMMSWWEKDKKLEVDGISSREWEGTSAISKWLRDKLNKRL